MKNLIRTLMIFGVIAFFTYAFNINSVQSNEAVKITNPEPPGFRVTVVGSNGAFYITCKLSGNPIEYCFTGQDGFVCNIDLSDYSQNYYDLYADNGLCQGQLLNQYWNGLGTTPVTIDVRAGCYK